MDKKPEDQITVAMATQPCRKDSYVHAVYELLPQCDRLCICFNGYDAIPENLPKSDKIVAVLANDKNGISDLGCDNKMYWLGDFPGYYATVDDDIDYPQDYICQLKHKVDQYSKLAICSYHGHVYNPCNGKMKFNTRRVYGFIQTLDHDVQCHRLGMGVAMCYPSKIGFSKSIFLSKPKNFGDDEITAIWAQENNVPLVRVENLNLRLIENITHSRKDGLCVNAQSIRDRIEYLESYRDWKLPKLHRLSNQLINIERLQVNSVQDLWIVTGQLNSATNEPIDSLTLFKYLQKNRIPSKYLIWKNHYMTSVLKEKNALKDVIVLDTDNTISNELVEKHPRLLARCKYFIQENGALNNDLRTWLKANDRIKYIFLQHGIFANSWLPAYETIVDRFNYINVFSIEEQKYILSKTSSKFIQSRSCNPFIIGGLPRYDLLNIASRKETQNTVFIMFTWRKTFQLHKDSIYKSKYYNALKHFINSQHMQQLKKKCNVVLSIHHHMLNTMKSKINFNGIHICKPSEVQYWICNSDICITDFSTVSFDFLFLKKPVIYWLLDANDSILIPEDQLKIHNAKADLQRTRFNVVNTECQLADRISHYVDNGFKLEDNYIQWSSKYFDIHNNICENLVAKISKL